MTDQERVNKAIEEACAILSEYREPVHIRNPAAMVKRLIALLERPELTAARERLEHAAGRRLRLVSDTGRSESDQRV